MLGLFRGRKRKAAEKQLVASYRNLAMLLEVYLKETKQPMATRDVTLLLQNRRRLEEKLADLERQELALGFHNLHYTINRPLIRPDIDNG